MAFVYLAHAAEDREFAARLSSDLVKSGISNWYDTGQVADEELYNRLQQATHLVGILSHAALLNERFLAALEYARENQLERLALRLTPIESMPPQLTGVLPLDFSTEDSYKDSLGTLLEDLRIEPAPPPAQLPEEIILLLESASPDERRAGLEAMTQYREADHPLREIALKKLTEMAFREPDTTFKPLIGASIRAFELETPSVEPETLPAEEKQEVEPSPPIVKAGPSRRKVYFWDKPGRWYSILIGLAVIIGLIVAVLNGELAYLLPILCAGLVLPYFNVWIREHGHLQWKMPKPLIGNSVVGILIAGLMSLILMAVAQLENSFLIINSLLGLVYGLVTGWLSTIETDSIA